MRRYPHEGRARREGLRSLGWGVAEHGTGMVGQYCFISVECKKGFRFLVRHRRSKLDAARTTPSRTYSYNGQKSFWNLIYELKEVGKVWGLSFEHPENTPIEINNTKSKGRKGFLGPLKHGDYKDIDARTPHTHHGVGIIGPVQREGERKPGDRAQGAGWVGGPATRGVQNAILNYSARDLFHAEEASNVCV